MRVGAECEFGTHAQFGTLDVVACGGATFEPPRVLDHLPLQHEAIGLTFKGKVPALGTCPQGQLPWRGNALAAGLGMVVQAEGLAQLFEHGGPLAAKSSQAQATGTRRRTAQIFLKGASAL